ncbi:uncharacterized protein LOC124157094 [Ischnura elegans]|uniref:uncharacterized protein LOC124157094 n=1 Tax=Ischnura elegans TaxID=197161 RepID=UPI001ED8A1AA|nr:uncharacterized protein LOC124157094 [Ischnura elegans]XP_046387533.1 uncharacterized protein LOC124157094 [Ischnura elegans]XP_046387534.1 uncharacterized protein LOC124157094 [Ischnura elegans]XP_046387535.1 uncharacterized protein LOC124157094 [Ischnura elegans]XP_046387536.1 uncharacterized protein LOC124157094 [Ischnura elegans]XP_046387537.1 uncharacterized protein LOC124157094 [Ischnura elegans]XP_046387538.1 uncharacterized protein LOC124157094 [Ischnura elegans]XP_046387539.1 unc
MPWVVAKFHSSRDGDGLSLTTFPSSWITEVGGKKYVLYPPVNVSGSELKRLVYKGAEPNGDWDLLHLKYVSQCFDSVTDALDFECKAADLSDADLAAMGGIGKRKRKAKDIRYPSEPLSSEDEDVKEILTDPLSTPASESERLAEPVEDQSRVANVSYELVGGKETGSVVKLLPCSVKAVKLIQNGAFKPRQLIPVHRVNEPQAGSIELQTSTPISKNGDDVNLNAPETETVTEAFEDRSRVTNMSYELVGGKEAGSVVKLLPYSGNAVKLMQNSAFKRRQLIPVHRVNEPPTSPRELQTNTSISKNRDDVDLKDLITKLDQKVTSQMEALMNKVIFIENSITVLSAAVKSAKPIPEPGEDFSECENVVDIPVDSLEDLHALHNGIASSSKFQRYVFKTLHDHSSGLMHKGVFSLNRAVNSILVKMMSNNVALLLCVKGRAPNKVSFEAHFPRLINLIFDVIKAKNVNRENIAMKDVKRSIGDWFRISKQRLFRGKSVTTFFEIAGRDVTMAEDGDSDS